MHENWSVMAEELTVALREVRGGTPEVLKAFGGLARAALQPGALDTKTKELMAIAIAVATRCNACVAFHAGAALKHGATRQEVMETVGLAIYMGAGLSVMYAAQALEAYDQFTAENAVAATA
jgi:AhpD family alkylhydroperoxidase